MLMLCRSCGCSIYLCCGSSAARRDHATSHPRPARSRRHIFATFWGGRGMSPIFIYHILICNSPFGGGSEPPPKFFCYTYTHTAVYFNFLL